LDGCEENLGVVAADESVVEEVAYHDLEAGSGPGGELALVE